MFTLDIRLHDTYINHDVSLYSILDLLADAGGLIDIVILIFSVFIKKYNYSLFILDCMQELFKTDKTFKSFSAFAYFK